MSKKNSKTASTSPPVQAYDEGWEASNCGVGRHRNPYTTDSELYEYWRLGWNDKFHGDKE